jgi:hypothetical protein
MTEQLPPPPDIPAQNARRPSFVPDNPQEMTLLTGLGLIVAGFLVAQIVGSILYAPLSLLVPGSVLTFIAITARPETPE